MLMMMMNVALVLGLVLGVAKGLYLEPGFDHHYTYSSESDILGMHNVTTIIKFRVRSVNETGTGDALNLLLVDSFVQRSEHGYLADNPMKWNLDHKFFFTFGAEGMVSLVHYHPEEVNELLILKKVLTSTLSANVRIGPNSTWSFISEEEDHMGQLKHEYRGERFSKGVRLERSHRSTSSVHRHHNKTLLMDPRGTVLHIESFDNISLHDPPSKPKRQPMEDEHIIQEDETGEFPRIASISISRVKLMAKRGHSDPSTHSVSGLKPDSIIVKEKPKPLLSLKDVESNIHTLIQCIQSYENKFERNRTECVHELRSIVHSLKPQDFSKIGEDALSKRCDENDTVCMDERNLFIDLIARKDSETSQQMILDMVMKHPNVTEEDLRRCLFHAIALTEPTLDFVKHVENLCFEEDGKAGETPTLSKTRKRACLSLGAMAKSLHDKNTKESERIVEQIENWLEHHNESKSMNIVKPRMRRALHQYDTRARKHVETKMVLIQSLGNAGKQRSLGHLKSYMAPDTGVSAWRRAAIHGLRHFTCNESADALLTSAVHDGDEVVRKTAIKVLDKHPRRTEFNIDHENMVLSKNYSYPIVSRVRRGLMETLEKGINVHIEPPGIEWDKVLGNDKIGASFGLHIRNLLDLKLGILSGHFMIDVYDGAFAEAHVGMLKYEVDIVKAYICFKGHIKYDLNVLKDFGINNIQDLVHIYDKIVGKIVTPIKDAVLAFKNIITFFKGHSLMDIVNTLVTTVKNLPNILGEVAKRFEDFVKEVFSIAASTVMEEIKVIIQNIRHFIDGVKQDILKFYNDVVDAITMGLPYIAKKIVEAYNLVKNGLIHLLDNPMQAITGMSRAIQDIKMAVTMIVDVKNKVLDACLFIKGRAAAWFDTAKKVPQMLKRMSEVIKRLVNSMRSRRDLVDDMESTLSDGVEKMKDSMHSLETDLKAKWASVTAPLQPLLEITKPFVDEFKAIVDLIKSVKGAYTSIKKVIQTSKSLVQKVFGPKFHTNFPTERRDEKGGCKSGVWPTTTDGLYKTTGVDVLLGKRQSVVNPVNGLVHRESDTKILIRPADPEFELFEIVIENVKINDAVDGKKIEAGKKIARALGGPKCGQSFIHVSIRQAQDEPRPDEDYDYTDPSPFLDRLMPVPKWIRECNDHEFRYIGQTFESGETEDGEPSEDSEKVERSPKENLDDIDKGLGDEGAYRPDDPALYDPTSFKDSLKKSLKEQAMKFAEFFKTALFGKNGPKVPNILDIVDISSHDVSWILDQLGDSSSIKGTFKGVLQTLSSTMTAIPKGNPATLGLPYVKNLLKMNGQSTEIGDVNKISDKLMDMAGKLCPMFKNAIAVGFGHVCTVLDDCLGISCSVPLPLGSKTEHVQIEVLVKPSESKIVVTVRGKKFELLANGIDAEIDLKVSFLGMKLSLVANCELKSGALILSAEAKLCVKVFSTCLPPIELFHEIKFSVSGAPIRHRRGAIQDKLLSSIHSMSLPNFISHLGDFQLLRKDITAVLDNVRKNVVDKLMEQAADKLGEIVKEFKDKVDFCLSANIPVPPFDIPFFNLKYYFVVGPVPLSLKFGAEGSVGLRVKLGLCVLSMKTQITLTPSVGGKVWGKAAVDIGFASAGIKLVGYLLETKFPILTELVFSKYPLDVGSRMDMVLKPLRLVLTAFAELHLLFTDITVFEGKLWEYSVPKIVKNIFNKKKRDDDPSPPDVMPATINARRRRSGTRGCIVNQIKGRRYDDTAFSLEMHAQDEVSDVKLFYAIGTHRGGTNVVDWTEMGGSNLLVPAKLPGGIPLYWSVKAKNSQGLEATVQCSLNTFDNTLPDGRVEHSYAYSSHPSKLVASVVAFEDTPLVETHYKAVGFSPGEFGSQFVDWQQLRLGHSVYRQGATGYLKQFTIPREGKLVAWVLQSQKTLTPEACAQKCVSYGSNCVSFDYEHHSETCDFHDVIEGANAYLRISGTYSNYERLGSGYHTPIEYNNLPLTHGSTYFVNTKVSNVLGYDAFLVGEGTMVDFTPPEPGLVRNNQTDILRADKCTAAITQRCVDVTWKHNHRLITDGTGSGTVFNGHEPLLDELYTLTNHYVSANWKGFHDDESGIWGYTWSVGKQICGKDSIPFEDPYAHLTNKKFWTDSAFHKGVHLNDGAYYVTVQALNGAELGGSLVTTLCHSTPFTVDTTPPVFSRVTDIIYDEDFDLIAIYYDADDALSKIAKAEFGLGKTKYDVQLKSYSVHPSMERDDPFVAVEELGLQEGIPAWIRVRVTNNVGLYTAGHGDEPILIDKSPPEAGNVLDGDRLRQDRKYQADDDKICAQWLDFYDPESGIDRYIWGVGNLPGMDDVVRFRNLTHYDKSACAPASLFHNHSYYSTVFAFNNALNSKSANSSSDGVLVDLTPPIAGFVQDGKAGTADLNYTSETVSKYCNWRGYHDPESGVEHYKVDVYINNEHKHRFSIDSDTKFEDHTISMEHKDQVYFDVIGVNGAELENTTSSNGFLVDLTPPTMSEISDNKDGLSYQSNNKEMNLKWNFKDEESGLKEYRTIIYESKYGVKQKFWPDLNANNVTLPPMAFSGAMVAMVDNLSMKDGARYSLHVTAINGALLATSHETDGVVIDTTPPASPKVHIGLPKDDEELDDDGFVLHDDENGIRVSWSGRDSESGIERYLVAIGTASNIESVSPYIDFGKDTTAYIKDIHLKPFSESSIVFIVSVSAVNGAGLQSAIGQSKSIKVLKANVPGIVFDGRNLYEDETFTTDHTSIAASFYGFASEQCSIVSYEWAVGTAEYGTDVLTFTDYGVVMNNDTHGQCQIHTHLYEDTTYYITVRAVTGCHGEYIVSASDGITFDRRPPEIIFELEDNNDTTVTVMNGVYYQDATDTLAITSNVSDHNDVQSTAWALGSLPLMDDLKSYSTDYSSLSSEISFVAGNAAFITATASDKAGNENVTYSLAIIPDITAPFLQNVQCTTCVSLRKSVVSCSWDTVIERESSIEAVTISIGTSADSTNILHEYVTPKGIRQFSRDLINPLKTFNNATSVFMKIVASNVVGQKKTYGREVIVDISVPEVERLDVVTSSTGMPSTTHQKCQLPTAYVELLIQRAEDKESEIDQDRYKVSIGLKPFGTEIHNYIPVKQNKDGIFFVDGFYLKPGTLFYATMRVYNKAGLYTDITSGSVVVSQSPYLTVSDGDDKEDIDYQSSPSVMQGHWEYSDACPIREAYWSIHDLSGNVITDSQLILSASKKFYNDEVNLKNGMKYIVVVKTVDFLNRTKVARSDGVTVRIQPPLPGHVRDGIDDDLNYQYSISDLSANWDEFGDDTKDDDPTQSIHHYEVAIGNDRRYAKTRSNVHFFVNVGLNTSYTFQNLNLTAKLVRYYITVRSVSMAGGYAEGYSNGIRVGYEDDIVPGYVTANKYQSSDNSIAVSWTGFRSDIDIINYHVGVSSHANFVTNDTLVCEEFEKNKTIYDVRNLHSAGINEYLKIDGLHLMHGHEYYITVVAKDEAGMCTAVTSQPILVDTTPVTLGNIYVNNMKSDTILFATSPSLLHISWKGFLDPESGVKQTKVTLLECKSCGGYSVTRNDCVSIAENMIENDNKTAFYEMDMDHTKTYLIQMQVTNGAQLQTSAQSSTILLDESPPYIGDVKISSNWKELTTYQYSTTDIYGQLPIANTLSDYLCNNQKIFFPKSNTEWDILPGNFSSDFLKINQSGAYLGIGYKADLSDVTRTAILSKPTNLKNGNFSFKMQTGRGQNIITTFSFISDVSAIPFDIGDIPVEAEFDDAAFENITGLEAAEVDENMTTTMLPTTIQQGAFVPTNDTDGKKETYLDTENYGFGVHFLGYRNGKNKGWHHIFWARNKFTSVHTWFRLDFDPSLIAHNYIIQVDRKTAYLEASVDLTLIVDNEEVVHISGFKFNADMKLAVMTWNSDGYKPPIPDIYHPFYSDAIVREIWVPDDADKLCLHGRGFYDGESGIKDIWLGVSDSKAEVGNISPLELYKSYCFPCLKPCEELCKKPCTDARITDGFTMLPLEVHGLNLDTSNQNEECSNITSETKCNSTAYYLNIKVRNHAGGETVAFSNAVQVDISPPTFDYVKCLDPDYSEDEPTSHIGSSSTIGAYWNCSEDISQIEHYTVRVISLKDTRIVMNSSNVGLKSKVGFTLNNGTFIDDERYRVEVTATNTAGLSANMSCTVLVSLYPPNVSGTGSNPLYVSPGIPAADDEPLWTSSQTEVGIQWDGGSNDTEFYEWKIGASGSNVDVFPALKVGNGSTGSAAIAHGRLQFDQKDINKTVSEFVDTRNMTPEAIHNRTNSMSDRDKSFFHIEPGRCIYQTLNAIGYSHIRSKIKGKKICIKRPEDVYVNKTISRRTQIYKGKMSSHWSKTRVSSPEVVIDAIVTGGGLEVGSLSAVDKSSDYGSAASADYKPYISDFSLTGDKTSRLLRFRIQKTCGMSFFVAPAPVAEFEQLLINTSVPRDCDKDPDYQPAFIYWDYDKEQWTHIDEGCREYLTAVFNHSTLTYSAEMCSRDVSGDTKVKRSAASTLVKPRALELVRIKRSFPNTAPRILMDTLQMTEDENITVTIPVHNKEDDGLIFEIMKQPSHVRCKFTDTTTGEMFCEFSIYEQDFYGEDTITVKVTETGLPKYEESLSHRNEIKLNIGGVPDPTDRYYIDVEGTIHRNKRPLLQRDVKFEANGTKSEFAGTIVLADVDGGEVFTDKVDFMPLGNATYTLTKADPDDIPGRKLLTSRYRTLTPYNLQINFSPSQNGSMTFKFIAQTVDGKYTPSVTLDIYILNKPCVYGHCSHLTNGITGCDDIRRSSSFADAGYFCVCTPGYTGQWCETEINECESEPCSGLFDCEDLINDYNCTINVPKLMAILICSLLALVGIIFLVVRLGKRYQRYRLSQSSYRVSEQQITNFRDYELELTSFKKSVSLMPDVINAEPLSRPATTSGVLLDSTSECESSPEAQTWVNPSWKDPEEDRVGVTSLLSRPGMMLPPHHHLFKQGKKPSAPGTTAKPPKPPQVFDTAKVEKAKAELEDILNNQDGQQPRVQSASSRASTCDFDHVTLREESGSRMTDIDV